MNSKAPTDGGSPRSPAALESSDVEYVMPTLGDILAVLDSVKRNGTGYLARCPAHDDRNPSLSISEGDDGRVLMYCHAGCGYADIEQALKLNGTGTRARRPHNGGRSTGSADRGKIAATYDYSTGAGVLLYQVVRLEPKSFRQRRPDGSGGWVWNMEGVDRVPYRLADLLESSGRVYVVEGEKDADRLAAEGLTATTNVGGAGKWLPEYSEHLRGRNVVVVGDADEAGKKHAQQVAASLHGVAASIRIIQFSDQLPKGYDVSDYVGIVEGAGLEASANEIQEWTPPRPMPDPAPVATTAAATAAPTLATGKTQLPFIKASTLATSTPERADWIAEGIVARGAITELDAKIKVGKTSLTLNLVNAVLTHRLFLGFATSRTPVCYLTEERMGTFRQGLGRVGLLEAEDLYVLFRHDVARIPWAQLAPQVVAFAGTVGAGLLIVDTLSGWARLRDDTENNAGAALEAMAPLEEAAGAGMAVFLSRHDRKSSGEIGDSARGSSAFGGAADIILHMERATSPGHSNRRKLTGVGRFDEVPAELVLEYADGQYTAIGTAANVDHLEARRALLDGLPGSSGVPGPLLDDLMSKLDIPRSTLQRALNQLVEEGLVCKNKGAGKTKRGNGYTLSGDDVPYKEMTLGHSLVPTTSLGDVDNDVPRGTYPEHSLPAKDVPNPHPLDGHSLSDDSLEL